MSCYNCGGSGWIITCIDDLCRGADECMHGDGEKPCPVCEGFPDNFNEDDERAHRECLAELLAVADKLMAEQEK